MKTRESDIETEACKWATSQGWMAMKFTSPSRRSVPDRILIRAGRVVFIEFKGPTGVLTSGQTREIARLKDKGAEVYVCRSVDEVREVLDSDLSDQEISTTHKEHENDRQAR